MRRTSSTRGRSYLALAALALLVLGAGCRGEEAFRRGQALLARGDLRGAFRHFFAAAAASPQPEYMAALDAAGRRIARELTERGKEAERSFRVELALRHYALAMEYAPEDAGPCEAYARLWAEQEAWARARERVEAGRAGSEPWEVLEVAVLSALDPRCPPDLRQALLSAAARAAEEGIRRLEEAGGAGPGAGRVPPDLLAAWAAAAERLRWAVDEERRAAEGPRDLAEGAAGALRAEVAHLGAVRKALAPSLEVAEDRYRELLAASRALVPGTAAAERPPTSPLRAPSPLAASLAGELAARRERLAASWGVAPAAVDRALERFLEALEPSGETAENAGPGGAIAVRVEAAGFRWEELPAPASAGRRILAGLAFEPSRARARARAQLEAVRGRRDDLLRALGRAPAGERRRLEHLLELLERDLEIARWKLEEEARDAPVLRWLEVVPAGRKVRVRALFTAAFQVPGLSPERLEVSASWAAGDAAGGAGTRADLPPREEVLGELAARAGLKARRHLEGLRVRRWVQVLP